MKKPILSAILLIILLALLLAACNLPEVSQSTASRMSDIQTEAALSATPYSKSPTSIATAEPSASPIPSTPTAYPTFHPELAVTVTPAQAAVCPAMSENEFLNLQSEFDASDTNIGWVTNAIDKGASPEQIDTLLRNKELQWVRYSAIDLTADGVPEVIVDYTGGGGEVYQCRDRTYEIILDYDTNTWPAHLYMDDYDLNRNGIPEIMITYFATSGGYLVFDILEWNGTEIQSVLRASHGTNANETSRVARSLAWNWNAMGHDEVGRVTMNGTAEIVVQDTNHDQFKEIIITENGPSNKLTYYETGPWLKFQVTFTWNGESFLLSNYQIDSPMYRYQALQEADRAFLMRDYDQALILYDKVIGSDVLEWYSMDRKKYLWDIYSAKQSGRNLDEIPGPYFRADEYQYLSAYARFRKMIIQLAAGDQADAFYSYQLIDQIYTEQNPGFWHAEMGRMYWKAVEEGMSLTDACQQVIEYVEQNPKLLEALGDQWHGQQSHIYVAADVCPLDEMDIVLLSTP
jgi:hypothetical protein